MPASIRAQLSEAGVPATILADIGGRALLAGIRRRAIIIGKRAGQQARPVIMVVADLVGQPISADMVVAACLRQAWRRSERRQECHSWEELQSGHLESPAIEL